MQQFIYPLNHAAIVNNAPVEIDMQISLRPCFLFPSQRLSDFITAHESPVFTSAPSASFCCLCNPHLPIC